MPSMVSDYISDYRIFHNSSLTLDTYEKKEINYRVQYNTVFYFKEEVRLGKLAGYHSINILTVLTVMCND